jgi:hypothetical protein
MTLTATKYNKLNEKEKKIIQQQNATAVLFQSSN